MGSIGRVHNNPFHMNSTRPAELSVTDLEFHMLHYITRLYIFNGSDRNIWFFSPFLSSVASQLLQKGDNVLSHICWHIFFLHA